MKSLELIQRSAKKGDYARVAQIIGGISVSTVRMVVYGLRKDHHDIQATFSKYLEQREGLALTVQKQRIRKQRLAA